MATAKFKSYKQYDRSTGTGGPKQWRSAFEATGMGRGEAHRIVEETKTTPYGILGLDRSATPEDLKRAYRRLLMQYHPDKNPDKVEECEEKTKQIIAAYTLLTNQ